MNRRSVVACPTQLDPFLFSYRVIFPHKTVSIVEFDAVVSRFGSFLFFTGTKSQAIIIINITCAKMYIGCWLVKTTSVRKKYSECTLTILAR